jgi:hypothetical protein
MSKEPNVGDIIEMSHGKWTARYMVVTVSIGMVTLRKCMLGKTKISFLRFPETIHMKTIANALIPSNKK